MEATDSQQEQVSVYLQLRMPVTWTSIIDLIPSAIPTQPAKFANVGWTSLMLAI